MTPQGRHRHEESKPWFHLDNLKSIQKLLQPYEGETLTRKTRRQLERSLTKLRVPRAIAMLILKALPRLGLAAAIAGALPASAAAAKEKPPAVVVNDSGTEVEEGLPYVTDPVSGTTAPRSKPTKSKGSPASGTLDADAILEDGVDAEELEKAQEFLEGVQKEARKVVRGAKSQTTSAPTAKTQPKVRSKGKPAASEMDNDMGSGRKNRVRDKGRKPSIDGADNGMGAGSGTPSTGMDKATRESGRRDRVRGKRGSVRQAEDRVSSGVGNMTSMGSDSAKVTPAMYSPHNPNRKQRKHLRQFQQQLRRLRGVQIDLNQIQVAHVRPGDTLWGFCERFLQQQLGHQPSNQLIAACWPHLWMLNQEHDLLKSGNPNLIFSNEPVALLVPVVKRDKITS